MSASNVVSLADFRARREGWEVVKVEPKVIPVRGGYEVQFIDPDETYAVRGDRAWLDALHAKLGRVLGK